VWIEIIWKKGPTGNGLRGPVPIIFPAYFCIRCFCVTPVLIHAFVFDPLFLCCVIFN